MLRNRYEKPSDNHLLSCLDRPQEGAESTFITYSSTGHQTLTLELNSVQSLPVVEV